MLLHPDVQLLRADAEPDPAARSERLWLGDFDKPKQVAVETAGLRLARVRSRQLNVIEPEDTHAPNVAAPLAAAAGYRPTPPVR